jgi:hypothetical protein
MQDSVSRGCLLECAFGRGAILEHLCRRLAPEARDLAHLLRCGSERIEPDRTQVAATRAQSRARRGRRRRRSDLARCLSCRGLREERAIVERRATNRQQAGCGRRLRLG